MAPAPAAKIKMGWRPLDTGKPEEYQGWRYAAKAEIIGSGLAVHVAMAYIAAIENPEFTAEALQDAIAREPKATALDARLFSAVLSCLGGTRRGALEGRIRATVPFAAGALALRCLDDWFQQGAARRQHAATRELLNLTPSGHTPAALERFLTRFRLLSQQAGPGVGS